MDLVTAVSTPPSRLQLFQMKDSQGRSYIGRQRGIKDGPCAQAQKTSGKLTHRCLRRVDPYTSGWSLLLASATQKAICCRQARFAPAAARSPGLEAARWMPEAGPERLGQGFATLQAASTGLGKAWLEAQQRKVVSASACYIA